jgi:hypothetical protein
LDYLSGGILALLEGYVITAEVVSFTLIEEHEMAIATLALLSRRENSY